MMSRRHGYDCLGTVREQQSIYFEFWAFKLSDRRGSSVSTGLMIFIILILLWLLPLQIMSRWEDVITFSVFV